MHRPIRKQTDNKFEAYSARTALSFEGERDLVRQELGASTDINVMMKKFGVGSFQRERPRFETTDYSVDRQAALESWRSARAAWEQLPKALRSKYSTTAKMLEGLASGQLEADLEKYELDRLERGQKPAAKEAAAPAAAVATSGGDKPS